MTRFLEMIPIILYKKKSYILCDRHLQALKVRLCSRRGDPEGKHDNVVNVASFPLTIPKSSEYQLQI